MLAVGRSVPQDLRTEVPHVQSKYLSLAHRAISTCGGPDPAAAIDDDAADRSQASAEIGVLAMEVDRRVESADAHERVASDREIAAVEDRANAQGVVHDQVRRRSDAPVVYAHDRPPDVIPVVESV